MGFYECPECQKRACHPFEILEPLFPLKKDKKCQNCHQNIKINHFILFPIYFLTIASIGFAFNFLSIYSDHLFTFLPEGLSGMIFMPIALVVILLLSSFIFPIALYKSFKLKLFRKVPIR